MVLINLSSLSMYVCIYTSHVVANRDQPTAIAYLLLRLTIGSTGELTPKLNNRLEQTRVKVRYTWFTELFGTNAVFSPEQNLYLYS